MSFSTSALPPPNQTTCNSSNYLGFWLENYYDKSNPKAYITQQISPFMSDAQREGKREANTVQHPDEGTLQHGPIKRDENTNMD